MVTSNGRWLALLGAAVLAGCGTGEKTTSSSGDQQNAVGLTHGQSNKTVLGGGAVLAVPSVQYPTIASALGAAKPGDTVRVEAGTYFECPVLVNGVSLVGPDVGLDEMPLVTLDGGGTCNPVISGDATIVDGALVRRIRITNAGSAGIRLNGSQGVRISQVRIRNTPGMGIIAEGADFTLDHSRVAWAAGRGGVVLHGTTATLVDNEIFGNSRGGVMVGRGAYLNPAFGPSRVQLVRNSIHDNGEAGVSVGDKADSVQGVGNSYAGNFPHAVRVLGGASYRGQNETLTVPPGGFGIYVQGCELRCATAGCGTTVLLLDRSSVRLNDSTIGGPSEAQFGIHAVCAADVEINRTAIAGMGTGAFAGATTYLSDTLTYAVPSTFTAKDSAFTDNVYAGVWLNEKDTSGTGSRNRFTANGSGLQLSAGASYEGRYDSFSNNSPGDGVGVSGCGIICANPDCSSKRYVHEVGRLRLDGASIENNAAQGVSAGCGADATILKSLITGSTNGIVASAYLDLGDGVTFNEPSKISAHQTVFSNNQQWGAIGYDSFLDLGTIEAPGLNSFLSNGNGSIANVSVNDVLAQWNWFGTANPAAIAATLGGYDINSIHYTPFLTRPPAGRSTK